MLNELLNAVLCLCQYVCVGAWAAPLRSVPRRPGGDAGAEGWCDWMHIMQHQRLSHAGRPATHLDGQRGGVEVPGCEGTA